MSSIAEFYSRNLATEVAKGMTQKAIGGGTNGRAPIGYLNVRKRDELGREVRTIELDPERAPMNPSARNTVAIRSAQRVASANPLVSASTAVAV